jgi:hypothetical protein
VRAFKAGPVRVRTGTRAELSEEARNSALLLMQSAAEPDAVRGPVRLYLAAVDRLAFAATHAAACDHLFIIDENGDGPMTPDHVGPHCCDAHDLPAGVYIRHDGMLCLVATGPTTREGMTRFTLDCGGRTEYAEYPAADPVDYWRAAAADGEEEA